MCAEAVLWKLLIAVRWLWLFTPQRGYIHPDEFFQSPEIVAGDVLNLDTYRSWEFQSAHPIRSIVFPLITCGPGFYALRLLRHVLVPNSYLLLILPRVTMALFGLTVDWFVLKLARRLKVNEDISMLLYTSSYISLVHYTRTLSNTIESFLFVALLYFTTDKQRDASVANDDKQSLLRRKSIHHAKQTSYSDNSMIIGCALAAGFFNRPTFLCFAAAPYTYWLLYSSYNGKHLLEVCRRLCSSGIAALMTALLFIVCDSLYYGTLSSSSIQAGSTAVLKGLTITPWNFVQYNAVGSNLAAHGIHPRYTHAVVNLPLLFGLLPLGALCHLANRTLQRLLVVACFVPVIALSVVVHQEARFLVPLLAPLALVCAGCMLRRVVRAFFLTSWIVLNVCGSVWFGVVHQGGVTAALAHVQHSSRYANSHLVFYHTYMPARYLLSDQRITVHDLAGGSVSDLSRKVNDITSDANILLVAPATVHHHLQADWLSFHVELLHKFAWHVSTEDWPRYHEDILCDSNKTPPSGHCRNSSMISNLFDLFSLNLYQVTQKSVKLKE